MLTQIRSRKNSRAVTESLLNMSEEPNNASTSILPIDEEIPKSYTQTIIHKNENKNLEFMNRTAPSFKTYLSLQKNSPSQSKQKNFIDEYLQRRELSITKVSVKFGRFQMAMSDTTEGFNQTCFLSKKLRQKEAYNKTEKKLNVKKIATQNIRYSLENEKQNNCRIYFSQQEEKAKKLKNINLLKRRYTFFGKVDQPVL